MIVLFEQSRKYLGLDRHRTKRTRILATRYVRTFLARGEERRFTTPVVRSFVRDSLARKSPLSKKVSS